ncbi:MAG: hypothetical protein V1688_03145 [bacterium]
MHKEIFTKEQIKLFPLIKKFSKNFGLVGGTAIVFNIGHRQSIDFDLFSAIPFDNLQIKRKILPNNTIDKILIKLSKKLKRFLEKILMKKYFARN